MAVMAVLQPVSRRRARRRVDLLAGVLLGLVLGLVVVFLLVVAVGGGRDAANVSTSRPAPHAGAAKGLSDQRAGRGRAAP
jgi:hypothetical protein